MWSTLARIIIFAIGFLVVLLPIHSHHPDIPTFRSSTILTFFSTSGVDAFCRIILHNSVSLSATAKELEWRCLPVGAGVGAIVGSIQLSRFLLYNADNLQDDGSEDL